MTSAAEASIVPITLTVNGRIGLTLWAPPWEDEDGEEWQGFLGDGAKIVLFPSAHDLFEYISTGEENDLSDHPAWPRVATLPPDALRPADEDGYDLDAVYELAAGEPDPVRVSALANVLDMVAKIADCCDDGALRRLVVGTPAYAELVEDEVSYQGKEGRKRWNELGDTLAENWERAITRVDSWLSWIGDFTQTDLEAESTWDRIGAEPIRITLQSGSYLTVRAEIETNEVPDEGADEAVTEVLFLGTEGTVNVFVEAADLAEFCRAATEHELTRLQWWEELADVEDDALFEPALDASYDLRKPSARGSALLIELARFCQLDADTQDLEDPIDKQTWTELMDEVETCLQKQG